MSAVGNKRYFDTESKLHFLSYSTGESAMIVELFSRRSFLKILSVPVGGLGMSYNTRLLYSLTVSEYS